MKSSARKILCKRESRPPHRGAWIEISLPKALQPLTESPPAQGGVD